LIWIESSCFSTCVCFPSLAVFFLQFRKLHARRENGAPWGDLPAAGGGHHCSGVPLLLRGQAGRRLLSATAGAAAHSRRQAAVAASSGTCDARPPAALGPRARRQVGLYSRPLASCSSRRAHGTRVRHQHREQAHV